MLNCLQFGNSNKKYSPDVRLFCLTLHYYSPKAYDYLRENFDKNIPAPRTLRSWYSSIDGSPGFTESAFDALEQKAKELKADDGVLICGLIFDEMSIRKLSQWNLAKKEFAGHISHGNKDSYDNCSPLAKHALVLMISGINTKFKIPVGFFFVVKLNGEEKAGIVMEAMMRINKAGIKLASITFDGDAANIKAMKILGASFENEQPFFPNPHDGSNVYVVLDPPHMAKLGRNILGNKGTLYDEHGEEIRWKYIADLIKLQISENVNLGNKLTKTHSEYNNLIMNVKVAVQTLSNSTAESIEYLDKVMRNDSFANSKATTNYIRVFNNLFDIMNSKEGHCDEEFKRPFTEETVNDFATYFQYAKNYLKRLTLIEEDINMPALKSRSSTAYFGFLHNMTSFMGIYKEHIKKNGIKEFYAFTICQDHVENFFGCIRRMNGCNDNPSIQQFTAAYRKLLFQNEVAIGHFSNCQIDSTSILTVSSRSKVTPAPVNQIELEVLLDYDFEHPIDDDAITNNDNNNIENNTRAYLGGIIEKSVIHKMVQKGRKMCRQCINVFTDNEITDDQFIAFKSKNSNIFPPCKSTLSIINAVEYFLERYDSLQVSFNTMVNHIVKNIDMSQLYMSSEFGENHDHKSDLVECIVKAYLDRKSTDVGKVVTRLEQQKLIRHDNLKAVHNQGQ